MALVLILALWIGMRVAILSVTADPGSSAPAAPLLALASENDGAAQVPAARKPVVELPRQNARPKLAGGTDANLVARFVVRHGVDRVLMTHGEPPLPVRMRPNPAPPERGIAPHESAMRGVPEAAGPAIAGEGQMAEIQPNRPARPRRPRWSADGWALVRGGPNGPALAAGAAAYGGSQMGAVLRYNLAPTSPIRPQVYLRAAAALSGTSRQPEAAFGLMLRPVRRLPLAFMGEVRVQDSGGQARARPVVTAVTEIPPLRLPLGAEGEVYAQAGWAGGRDATPFYDMAAVAQRSVLVPAPGTQLRVGTGLWSGGQRGAARLDIGPRIELHTLVGPPAQRIGVRLAVDWRFRVAGEAEPGSGPAVTLAAGF